MGLISYVHSSWHTLYHLFFTHIYRQVPPIVGKFTHAELIQWGQERDRILPASRVFRSYMREPLFPWENSSLVYNAKPKLDYTRHDYTYPNLTLIPPPFEQYPPLDTLEHILNTWPQDDYDHPPTPFVERIQHFDYNNAEQLEAALRYRDLELPFKVYNVPEVIAAGKKWTGDYLSSQFDPSGTDRDQAALARGYCEEVRMDPSALGKHYIPLSMVLYLLIEFTCIIFMTL